MMNWLFLKTLMKFMGHLALSLDSTISHGNPAFKGLCLVLVSFEFWWCYSFFSFDRLAFINPSLCCFSLTATNTWNNKLLAMKDLFSPTALLSLISLLLIPHHSRNGTKAASWEPWRWGMDEERGGGEEKKKKNEKFVLLSRSGPSGAQAVEWDGANLPGQLLFLFFFLNPFWKFHSRYTHKWDLLIH